MMLYSFQIQRNGLITEIFPIQDHIFCMALPEMEKHQQFVQSLSILTQLQVNSHLLGVMKILTLHFYLEGFANMHRACYYTLQLCDDFRQFVG